MSRYVTNRFDFVRLSTEQKPTENIVDGSTCYMVDTQELYIYYKGTWYNQDAENNTQNTKNDNQVKSIEDAVLKNKIDTDNTQVEVIEDENK